MNAAIFNCSLKCVLPSRGWIACVVPPPSAPPLPFEASNVGIELDLRTYGSCRGPESHHRSCSRVSVSTCRVAQRRGPLEPLLLSQSTLIWNFKDLQALPGTENHNKAPKGTRIVPGLFPQNRSVGNSEPNRGRIGPTFDRTVPESEGVSENGEKQRDIEVSRTNALSVIGHDLKVRKLFLTGKYCRCHKQMGSDRFSKAPRLVFRVARARPIACLFRQECLLERVCNATDRRGSVQFAEVANRRIAFGLTPLLR